MANRMPASFRASATLTEHGVAADALSAASYGEYRPRADNRDEVGRAANRRIEIVLPPDLSMLPGAEELEKAIAHP
jgi:chemotaxis protein MotB